jgi:hypothetical protein
MPGATWQPTVTPKSSKYRPYIDGEPAVAAIAARVDDAGGWVDVVTTATRPCDGESGEPGGIIVRMAGHVELRRDRA